MTSAASSPLSGVPPAEDGVGGVGLGDGKLDVCVVGPGVCSVAERRGRLPPHDGVCVDEARYLREVGVDEVNGEEEEEEEESSRTGRAPMVIPRPRGDLAAIGRGPEGRTDDGSGRELGSEDDEEEEEEEADGEAEPDDDETIL